MIAPLWAKIIVPLAIVAAIFFAGYKVATWKWSGAVTKMEAERDAAVKEAAERKALEEGWRADIQNVTEQLRDMAMQRDQALQDYHEAVNKPPEVVVRYRDRWHTAPATIVSEDCAEGLGQLFEYLHSLPERPQ